MFLSSSNTIKFIPTAVLNSYHVIHNTVLPLLAFNNYSSDGVLIVVADEF